MTNKKRTIIIVIIVVIIVALLAFILLKNKENNEDKSTVDDITITMNTDDGDEKIDWSKYQEKDYTLSKTITISEEGTYNLTGTIEDGQIIINTNGNVKLNFNNVTITSSNGPAIYIKSAEDVVITLTGTNTLTDSSSYENYDEDIDGCLYSKADLTIEGDGELIINANYKDGIVSKDDLKIKSGNYTINSKDDAIRGTDSVYIIDGKFNINSAGDGIKSTNEKESDKGFVYIVNGTFNIEATLDAIQAETLVEIDDGTFNITTGGSSTNSSKTNNEWGRWQTTSNEDSESAKGIKSSSKIVIKGGTYNLDTSDDSIHSNEILGISNGTFTISSGDDGLHADDELIIDNGKIDINKSYEGIEATSIIINDGNINVTSSDDGLNAGGGTDQSSMNRPGANNVTTNSSDNKITINDGTVTVNAEGDGIDSNGSVYINGGYIIVYGPTNDGNGALDYDSEFVVNGGTLIAGGSSGMAQGCSNDSDVYSASIYFNSSISNKEITIEDEDGNELITYTSDKSFNFLAVATKDFKKGSTYTIKIDGEEYTTFKISSNVTTVGTAQQTMGGMQQGGQRR